MPFNTRRLSALAVASVTSLAVTLSLGPGAHAKIEKTEIPAGASVKIDGKGFGHGRGMSQYGAQGAARQGLDHSEIVEFYYPGTQWSTVRGHVSVLISADTTDDLVVKARSHLKLRDIKGKKVHTLPANGATEWRLRIGSTKRTILESRKGKGRWKVLTKFHGEAQFGAGGRPISLVLPSGRTVDYRGVLRHAAPSAGSTARDTVNVVTMEHYLRGVVPTEIPASWHQEAVKAQAVAARTYATFERKRPLAKHYQICDTTRCQVYGGASAEHKLTDTAIKATSRQIITFGGQPAFTQFSSSNGGWAASGSLAYQVSRQDPYDGWAGNPVHDWSTTVTTEAIERAWPAVGKLVRISVTGRNGVGEYGGRVTGLTLVGTNSKVRINGDQFRSGLGLRSNWFTFSVVQPRKAKKK